MNVEPNRGTGQSERNGFTTAEVLVASFITVLISAGVMTCFMWCAEQASLGVKIAWSQNEAMRTSSKLTDYIRNAVAVHRIDTASNTWVELLMTNGAVVRLSYSNALDQLRDGRMYLQTANGTDTLVARGLTKIMDDTGYSTPIFSLSPNSNVLQVAYRVSEPAASGGRETDDGDFAVSIRFGVYLRNIAQ